MSRPAQGFVVWITGLPGAGKSTCARMLEQHLLAASLPVEVLDGDVVRQHLSRCLGYSKKDRDENVRRIGFVAELLSRNGIVVIVAAISPYRATREEVRTSIPRFLEVYIDCPLELLIERDVKGLYKKALAGEVQNFTGISDPYEPPIAADVTIDSSLEAPEEELQRIWEALCRKGWV